MTAKKTQMTVEVDVTGAHKKFLQARLTLAVQPGPLTLFYPKWIPGEHGPTGPITDLAGLKITAQGKTIPWLRDDLDMYAFHFRVPEKTESIEITLNYLPPAQGAGFTNAGSTTPFLAIINWNQLLLYPKGPSIHDVECRASARLPEGWKLGTALPILGQKGTTTEFGPVSLATLVDAPVLCGLHFKEFALGPKDGVPHFLILACDSPAGLELSPGLKDNLDRLVLETEALFGSRHYRSYKFLHALSDNIAHFGLEHHESSDNRTSEKMLVNDAMKRSPWGPLLPHEFVHSWNGKHRRPAEMVTGTFHEPQRTRLLWVYEGLTQYLGLVLTARCGLWTAERTRDQLAQIVEWAQNQKGRSWRPLEDTAVAAQLLFYSRSDGASWRRGVDFYDEGVLLWLDVDTLIREKTRGEKSLDDFCRRFCGGPGGKPNVKPYSFDDIVADLNAIVPHDWKGFLTKRVKEASPLPPLDGIHRSGWKLSYADKPPDLYTVRESEDKIVDLTASLGLLLKEDGTVVDVIPGKAAHMVEIGPGMKLLAVNGQRWSAALLRQTLAESKKVSKKIELLLENAALFRTYTLDYRGGDRYPELERDQNRTDLLSRILEPRMGKSIQ